MILAIAMTFVIEMERQTGDDGTFVELPSNDVDDDKVSPLSRRLRLRSDSDCSES